MIVFDEQLASAVLMEPVAAWYRGAVTDITQLRESATIKDDAVPAILRTVRHPVFVTIDVDDFWHKIETSAKPASQDLRNPTPSPAPPSPRP